MFFEAIQADPPTLKNAGMLGSDVMGPKALLDNGWVVIVAGLLLGLAWHNVRKLARPRRRALAGQLRTP
jgi:hypothetical protein